jgi:hypothetical protein
VHHSVVPKDSATRHAEISLKALRNPDGSVLGTRLLGELAQVGATLTGYGLT